MKELESSKIFELFSESLNLVVFEYDLTVGLSFLAALAVIFHVVKISITMLLGGGQPFDMNDLRKPGFMLLLISAWPFVDDVVRDLGTKAFQYQVSINQEKLENANKLIYQAAITKREETKAIIEQKKIDQLENMWVDDKLVFYLSSFDDKLMATFFDGVYGFLSGFDYFIYLCFGFVSSIWLKIIGLGGPIALTFSLLFGNSILVNWIKTYISVSLWLVVGSLVLSLINNLGVQIISYFMDYHTDIMSEKAFSLLNYAEASQLNQGIIISLILISLMIILSKLILISKVPTMINSFISGGGSAGGGLSAAFIPISIAKNVTQAAATGGASLAGKAAGSMKK